ncbi:MAG TPA: pirin family protein [Ghiorsea sp.]|nr:pirin family protein [Ghiorsea sp.]
MKVSIPRALYPKGCLKYSDRSANMKKVNALTVPEGDGVVVNRLMPVHSLMNFDPFVLMDHFDIEAGGFPDHPHRGFEAITYMLGGGMQHVDNLGNTSTVHAGGLQRFTAGKGIVHSEMPEGKAQGIQLWINLPKHLKQMPPSYQQVDAKDIPEDTNGGVVVRTVVGLGSPTKLQTSVVYLDVSIKQGSVYQRDMNKQMRGFVYVLEGVVSLNQELLTENEAMFFDAGETLSLLGKHDSRLIVCFGQPHGEPIHQHGPYVD